MGIELNSDKNSKVTSTEPDVKEEENRDNLHNETLEVHAKKYEQLQVELEECRNRIEELKLHHDKEKAGKEQTLKTLATYEKKIRDERQQYVQQINSLESIVMMLKLKAKNSADHASRLEERLQELKTENEQLQSHCDFMMNILIEGEMDTEQTDKVASSNNNPTVSRNTGLTVTTAATAPTFTFGSTSSTGTTSTSGFTFGQTPKTTQSSSSSGFVFGSTSSNAPSSLASTGIQSNACGQSSTFSFGASPSTSQAKQPASSASLNSLSIASTTAASTASSTFGKPTASNNSLKVWSHGTKRKTRDSNLNDLLLGYKIKFDKDLLVVQRNSIKAKRRLPRN